MATNNDNTNKSSVEAQPTLQVWPSSSIRYAYLESNYARDCGTLGGSCMRTKTMQKALNFYAKNNVKIVVVVTANNKIHARALLWENILLGNGKKVTYLDRIFFTSEKYLSLYQKFVKKNNYAFYHENFSKNNSLCMASVNLSDITHVPYTDTFRYLDYKKKMLYNDKHKKTYCSDTKGYITLTTTNNYGYCSQLDKNSVLEVFTGNFISKKDSVYVKRYEGYVLDNHILKFDGVYYSQYDSKNVKAISNNKHCLIVNIVSEAFTSKDIDKTKSTFISKYDSYISKNNIIVIYKIKYSKHDPNIVCFENKYYLIGQCFRHKDSGYIPKNRAIIVYDTTKFKDKNEKTHIFLDKNDNPSFNKKLYLSDMCKEGIDYIKMNTGDFLYYTPENRSYIRKYNDKYYLKHLFELVDKHQLLLFK